MSVYVPGLDYSRYQYLWNEATGEMLRAMDFDRTVQAGVKFVAGRVTLGVLTDYAYDYRNTYCSLRQAQASGLPTTGYHVVRPMNSAPLQMDAFFRALDKYSIVENFPFWLDCERPDGMPRSVQTQIVVQCIEAIHRERGYFPDIYTNVNYWDSNILADPIFAHCRLIVANYTTRTSPLIPFSWRSRPDPKWRVWQYSADGNGMGAYYGAASHSIDLDRCYSQQVYDEMLFATAPIPPDPGEHIMIKFTTLVANQAVRSEPSTRGGNGTVVGRLPAGTEVGPVVDIAVNNPAEVWFLFEQGWMACVHGGTQYLEEIS